MSERVERIERVGRIKAIQPYSMETQTLRIHDCLQAAQDRAELHALLAKYPNPEHLSFAELLEQAVNDRKKEAEELDFVLDLGRPD